MYAFSFILFLFLFFLFFSFFFPSFLLSFPFFLLFSFYALVSSPFKILIVTYRSLFLEKNNIWELAGKMLLHKCTSPFVFLGMNFIYYLFCILFSISVPSSCILTLLNVVRICIISSVFSSVSLITLYPNF